MSLPFKYKKVKLNDLTADDLEDYCYNRLIHLTGQGCEGCPFYNDTDRGIDNRCLETTIYNLKKAQELIDKNIELEILDYGKH